MADQETLYKILVIGETQVGKSSIILRYVDNSFTDNFHSTIGVDFKSKQISIENNQIKLQIWDTAGQEKFRSITKAYYHGAKGILIVFDITKMESFKQMPYWIDSVRQICSDTVEIVLVGNKSDMDHYVSRDEIETLTSRYDLPYIETSAKDGTNINEAFELITNNIYNRFTKQEIEVTDLPKPNNTEDTSCC